MNGFGRSLAPREGGQALVEFALVAPIFFLMVFSIIELGILFGGQNGLVGATREEARYTAPYRVKTAVDATNVCADTRLGTQLTGFLRRSIPGYVAANVGSRQVTYSWVGIRTAPIRSSCRSTFPTTSRCTSRWLAGSSTASTEPPTTGSCSTRPNRCESRTRT